MIRPRYQRLGQVRLTDADRAELSLLWRKGRQPVRLLKRARVLALLDQGVHIRLVVSEVGVAETTARRVARRYLQAGLAAALQERRRPGQRRILSSNESAEILVMINNGPPPGHVRWSIRVIAQEAVRCHIVSSIGRETIRQFLHGLRIKPWQ